MIRFNDSSALTGRTKSTKEGYLIATSRVARTGIQKYLARELGDVASHLPPNQVVSVYRHEDQVFSDDALQSLTRVPVTLNHPPVMVDASNHSEYSVGDVGDAFKRDGDWIVVQPMLKDSDAVTAAKSTHKEISMGYTANIVPARDGVNADFEMTDIRFNHLALVTSGRAGREARIGDADNWGVAPVTVEDNKMTVELKTVILGDKAVEVKATDADTVAALLKDHKTAVDAKDAEIGTLTAKLADAEGKILSDEAIAALVDAKVVANEKRAKVAAVIGDDKAKAMSDAAIEGALAVIGDGVADNTVRGVIADNKQVLDHDAKIKAAQDKFLNPERK